MIFEIIFFCRYNNTSIETSVSNKGLFEKLPSIDLLQTVALINPMGDGNCGFRAVSLSVFGHEDAWIQVKQSMYRTLCSNRNVYETFNIDFTEYSKKLSDIKSPCLDTNETYMWFETTGCPQVVADTFNRHVVLLTASPKVYSGGRIGIDSNGNIEYNNERGLFSPFFELDTNYLFDPIVLFIFNNHYYLVERNVNTRTKKSVDFEHWPKINPLHRFVMEKHGDICPNDLSNSS